MKGCLAPLLRPRLARYLLAVALVAIALLLRWALTPIVGAGTYYLIMFPAMMAVAVTFGVGPGLVGNALGIILVEIFFVDPGHFAVTVSLAVRAGVLMATALYVGRVADRLRTARRQAEEAATALCDSEAKYRTLFANMAEEVHFWQLVRDEQGAIKTWRLVDANPPTLATWGKRLEEIRGKTTDEIFGPGATEHYLPVVTRIIHDGIAHSYEDYFPNLDKHFRFTSVPLCDHFVTTGADITRVKKAEEAMRRAEERLRLLGDNLPDSALYQYTHDGDGVLRFLYVSAGIERLNGIRAEDALLDASVLHRQIPPGHIERLAEAEARSARDLSDFDLEVPMQSEHGGTRWMRLHSRPRQLPSGQVVWDGVQIDVTDRHQAEEERERLIADLEEAIKELEGITYTVSHDLRAPLRHIGSFAQLLKHQAWPVLDDKGRHYLDTVLQAAEKLGILADELLGFSRMGRIELKPETVCLDALVREVIAGFAPEASGRDIRWRMDPLPALRGDPPLLRLVFQNLIGNALKFTRGCCPASIDIGYRAAESQHVFSVRDNGVGFDMQYADKLFGVFQRLHPLEPFEGSGIGLANVHRIVQRHGGRIWAEGRPGEGATFSFNLPAEGHVVSPTRSDLT